VRDEGNLVQTDGGRAACAEKFWDIPYLQKALGEQCPQLQIRRCDNASGIEIVLEAPARSYLDPNYSNGTFRAFMSDVLEVSGLNFTDVTPSNPAVINFGDTYIVSHSEKTQSGQRWRLKSISKFKLRYLLLASSGLTSGLA
jgi:hypothetical protein